MLGRAPSGRRHPRPPLVHAAVAVVCTISLVVGSTRGTARSIEALSWSRNETHTTVRLVLADPIDAAGLRRYRLADPVREVVVLSGFTEGLDPDTLALGDGRVERVRLVLQDDRDPPELLVVLDLVDEDSALLEVELQDRVLEIVIGPSALTSTPGPMNDDRNPGPPDAVPAASAPVPTSTAVPPPPTPAIPDPAATPTPPSVPTATPTATTAFVSPVPPTEPSPSPSPSPTPSIAEHAVDLSASPRGDGSTLVMLTADGRLPVGCARLLEVEGTPPRIIVTVRGISAPDLPRSIEIGDANLDRIRLVHNAETPDGELHLVLFLSRPGVNAAEINQVGSRLVVLLVAADPSTAQ